MSASRTKSAHTARSSIGQTMCTPTTVRIRWLTQLIMRFASTGDSSTGITKAAGTSSEYSRTGSAEKAGSTRS